MTACVALALLIAGATPAAASDSRIFTLAGGGADRPREGALATSVRIGDADQGEMTVAALPDGSVATIGPRSNPLLVSLDGRVRLLPPVRDEGERIAVAELEAERDGGLLTIDGGRAPRHIYRLAPGATAWTNAVSLEAIVGRNPDWSVTGLASAPDGTIVFSGYDGLRRAYPDGRIERVPAGRPGRSRPGSLEALADGSVAFAYGDGADIAVVAPGGAVRRLTRGFSAFDRPGLAATADGSLLRADVTLDEIAPDGVVRPIAGHRPGLGPGDGGPPAGAQLHAFDVDLTPDGAIVVAESSPHGVPRPRWDLPADERPGGRLLTESLSGFDEGFVLRTIVSLDNGRVLAAVGPRTFDELDDGRVEVVSTTSGTATVTAHGRDGRASRIEQAIPTGASTVALPKPPTPGDYEVLLGVVSEDGRRASADLAVATVRRLSMRRARRIVRRVAAEVHDIGYYARTGDCRRRNATMVDCQWINVTYDEVNRWPRCEGIATARLRPDGVRVVQSLSRKRCRALGKNGNRSRGGPAHGVNGTADLAVGTSDARRQPGLRDSRAVELHTGGSRGHERQQRLGSLLDSA